MAAIDRRNFLKTGAVGALASATAGTGAFAQGNDTSAASSAASAPAGKADPRPPKVTRILAEFIQKTSYQDLPANVRREGVRTLMNWVGVAVGGSHDETVNRAVSALTPFSGPPQANLLGRTERFDIVNAAFINGVSSHIFDYDDTHLKTIIHPAGPVVSAILAYSQYRPVSGADFLNALVLGVETELRIGNAVYPNHYDVGWHITGTCGVFGSAAAMAKLMHLSVQQTVWALGLAASQPVGLRESFGSMNKSFNPGRAAANGMFAAILANQDYTSSDGMIEAKRGWANTISTKQDYREITDGLGTRWESTLNTYKPFACGIVIHPALDAAIQLRDQNHLSADQIERIDLRVHPLVIELTGKKTPQIGLEGKFSIYHAVAIAIIDGAAGEKQFSDAKVRDPQTVALREKVNTTVDPSIKPEQVDMTITLKDGRKLHKFIEHAIGSTEVPMTDEQLEKKFRDLAEGILPSDQTQALIQKCWRVAQLGNAAEIATAAVRRQS
ncbi:MULTISPECIES: MmgE/PrpD family protein [unclassified Caballeronia]|uniref:MmgE/PrpD family protein n=1 Tax=unclassified Caballeronia TaxID=2646786 RepID=UPI002027A984|nr:MULTISPECIES: MmgE/PrpD family protein [unclassified Caballeronia]MDR5769865.1 MmgE/PrpD family protein [Caballeronia sp. LZ028]